jgi:amidophosphoribosyltransferase
MVLMPSPTEFVAHDRDIDQIAQELGVDKLIYQDLTDLEDAINFNNKVERFDSSCFNGEYITGDIDEQYLAYIDSLRNDANKESTEKSNAVIELHNNS